MADTETEKIVYIATHAGEDPDRASLPFVLANAAQVMEVEAVVVLQGTAVYLAKKGYLEHIHAAGLAPLKELVDSFREAGGKLMVCVPCIKERKIEESDLIEGAVPAAGGTLTLEILSANATLVY
ncbi:MAG: multidrug transporter [Desulfobacteraceae bacterium 4484_190.2]|nr:MAG: multidrug transporter [Desulfobacteraceae bacterium 4484_190.2]